MNLRTAVGQIIRAERQKAGYTQRSFGEALGCEQSAWGKVENGKAGLPFERFVRVCELLNIGPSNLVGRAVLLSERLSKE